MSAAPDDFDKRLAALRQKEAQKQPDTPITVDEAKLNASMNIGMRAGSEFISHLIAGGIIGWALDHYLKTSPLFMILLILAGFGTGLYRTQSIMNKKS